MAPPRIVSSGTGRGGVKISTTGVIFDRARREGVLRAALAEGTRKLLPQVVTVVRNKLDTSLLPPEETGRYKRSITSRAYPSGTGVVKSTDTRKIKNWIEKRVRNGHRLGRGAYPFRAGKTFARSVQKKGYYHPFVVRALRG